MYRELRVNCGSFQAILVESLCFMRGGDIDRFLHTRDGLLTKGGKKYVKRRDADAYVSDLVHQMRSQR